MRLKILNNTFIHPIVCKESTKLKKVKQNNFAEKLNFVWLQAHRC